LATNRTCLFNVLVILSVLPMKVEVNEVLISECEICHFLSLTYLVQSNWRRKLLLSKCKADLQVSD